eukprot:gene30670-39948_t
MNGPCIILSVAEKPSVAKELARVIPRNCVANRRQGFSPYNHIYDIENCAFKNHFATMKITSVTGHMMDVDFDDAHKGWQSCQPIDLFDAPVEIVVKKESLEIKRTLVNEARQCNVLLLWLDGDLEGENIAYEVSKVCLEANPRLDVYRARFSSLLERDITRALNYPDRLNFHMNDAVEARREIDLRIGAAFSRFQTKRLQHKFENLGSKVISYGSCQFPTLGFVIERELKIKAFIPENFWYISCEVQFVSPDNDRNLTCSFQWDRSRLYDRLGCLILYEMCLEGGGEATVVACESKPTSRWRPCPLNTIELTKRASRYLRMGSDRTMAIAEAMYQRGIISYPRTETDYFTEEEQTAHTLWGAFATDLLQREGQFLWPKNGGHDDQAHPPIHPVKAVELADLESDEERGVYELITRHFLACCAQDAKGNQTKIKVEIPLGGERFSATGLMILELNWMNVYKYEKWTAVKVPVCKIGDKFTPKKLLMVEGRTTPPEPINESDLITEMDKNGIGTDATIASHISTIQQREYATKDGQNRFKPTLLGLALYEAYNNMGYQLTKPHLRAAMERDCQRVARGELPKQVFLQDCLRQMRACLESCVAEARKLDEAMAKYFAAFGSGADHEAGAYNVRFLHCSGCNKGHVVPNGDLTAHTLSCKICNFQVLNVRNPGTNKQHTVCPFCFKNPPEGADGMSDFRCFACTRADCDLSGRPVGSDVAIAGCPNPQCAGSLKYGVTNPKQANQNLNPAQNQNQIGNKTFLISCSSSTCKFVWYFPKFIRSVLPKPEKICEKCLQSSGQNICKVLCTIILAKAPPGTEPEQLLCVSCADLWTDSGHAPLSLRGQNPTAIGRPVPGSALKQGHPHGPGPGPGPGPGYAQGAVHGQRLGQQGQGYLLEGPQRLGQGPVQGHGYPPEGPRYGHGQAQAQAQHGYAQAQIPGPGYGQGRGAIDQGRQQLNTAAQGYPAHQGFLQQGQQWPNQDIHIHPQQQQQQQQQYSKRAAEPVPAPMDYAAEGPWARSVPLCRCGQPARSQEVKKDGNNKGRSFFTCSKSRDEKCDFFQFVDEVASGERSSRPFAPSVVAEQLCLCGEASAVQITQKEGANKGRAFYCCRKA